MQRQYPLPPPACLCHPPHGSVLPTCYALPQRPQFNGRPRLPTRTSPVMHHHQQSLLLSAMLLLLQLLLSLSPMLSLMLRSPACLCLHFLPAICQNYLFTCDFQQGIFRGLSTNSFLYQQRLRFKCGKSSRVEHRSVALKWSFSISLSYCDLLLLYFLLFLISSCLQQYNHHTIFALLYLILSLTSSSLQSHSLFISINIPISFSVDQPVNLCLFIYPNFGLSLVPWCINKNIILIARSNWILYFSITFEVLVCFRLNIQLFVSVYLSILKLSPSLIKVFFSLSVSNLGFLFYLLLYIPSINQLLYLVLHLFSDIYLLWSATLTAISISTLYLMHISNLYLLSLISISIPYLLYLIFNPRSLSPALLLSPSFVEYLNFYHSQLVLHFHLVYCTASFRILRSSILGATFLGTVSGLVSLRAQLFAGCVACCGSLGRCPTCCLHPYLNQGLTLSTL